MLFAPKKSRDSKTNQRAEVMFTILVPGLEISAFAYTPSGDVRLIFGLGIAVALLLALVTALWARLSYRQSRRRWPRAKPIFVMIGAGMELLAGSWVFVALYLELGFYSPQAMACLIIAWVFFALGIPTLFIGLILSLIARFRYGTYSSNHRSPDG